MWSLRIAFQGILNDQLHGFYRSTFKDAEGRTHVMAATQFEAVDARPVGTTVTLHLKDNFRELSDESALRARLLHYCALLPLPVFVGHDPGAVNAQPAPWRVADAHPARARAIRLEFARRLERRTGQPAGGGHR